MTRRAVILALPQAIAGRPQTPRNRVATLANTFIASWSKWANAINRSTGSTLDAREPEAWAPMPKQFRDLEHARREWLQRPPKGTARWD